VLTGDAAYCKDPITGLGIGDAFTQAFLLSEALQAAFAGGAWEPIMRAYQERRDRAVLPAYEATVALARASAVPAEAIGWVRAVVGNPWQARWLAVNLPGVVGSSGLFPENTTRLLERKANAFGVASNPAAKLVA
jgi:2-polyprenyl-6-methoxyphenol hydroxylase-like FAD-dependent oxidoreductase